MDVKHIPCLSDNETKGSYVQLVTINTSKYFDQCWLKVDPCSNFPLVRSTDPSYVFSDTESILFGVYDIFLSVFGSAMNLLVILAILRSSELRKEYLTPSILSIALNDFIFSCGILPVTSLLGFMKDLPLPYGSELYGFITFVLWQGSIFNLLEVAILRCVVVFFPQICQTQNFSRACIIGPVLAWILSILALVPVLSRQYGRFGFICKLFAIGIIGVDEYGNALSPHPFKMYMVVIIISGLLLILLNVITFFQVSRKTRKLFLQIKDVNLESGKKVLQKEKDIGKMVMIITGSFLLVFCPQITLLLVDPYAYISKSNAYIFTLFLSSSLVIIDPIIYCVSHEKYREEIKSMLKACGAKLCGFISMPYQFEKMGLDNSKSTYTTT